MNVPQGNTRVLKRRKQDMHTSIALCTLLNRKGSCKVTALSMQVYGHCRLQTQQQVNEQIAKGCNSKLPDLGCELSKHIKATVKNLELVIISWHHEFIDCVICRGVGILAGAELCPDALKVLDQIMIGILLHVLKEARSIVKRREGSCIAVQRKYEWMTAIDHCPKAVGLLSWASGGNVNCEEDQRLLHSCIAQAEVDDSMLTIASRLLLCCPWLMLKDKHSINTIRQLVLQDAVHSW